MYSMPDFAILAEVRPSFTCEAKILPKVESSYPGTTIGILFSAAAKSQHSDARPSCFFYQLFESSRKNIHARTYGFSLLWLSASMVRSGFPRRERLHLRGYLYPLPGACLLLKYLCRPLW